MRSDAIIDGRDMTAEAIRPRVKGETTFVDGLIEFAVATANQCLVPQGIDERHWKEFSGVERFYLKLIDLETKGFKTLNNYQNFAKAFKVRDFRALMGNQKANEARLKSAVEFGKSEMSEGAEDELPRVHQRDQERLRRELRDSLGGLFRGGRGLGGRRV